MLFLNLPLIYWFFFALKTLDVDVDLFDYFDYKFGNILNVMFLIKKNDKFVHLSPSFALSNKFRDTF